MNFEEELRMNEDEHESKNNSRHKLLSVFFRVHPWFLLPLGSTEHYDHTEIEKRDIISST